MYRSIGRHNNGEREREREKEAKIRSLAPSTVGHIDLDDVRCHRSELKFMFVDVDDDGDEFEEAVCSSRCVFLCNLRCTNCVKRAEHE